MVISGNAAFIIDPEGSANMLPNVDTKHIDIKTAVSAFAWTFSPQTTGTAKKYIAYF
jgi:hypothetical protein